MYEYNRCVSEHLEGLGGGNAPANAIGFVKTILNRGEWPPFPGNYFTKWKGIKKTSIWEMKPVLNGVHYRYFCYYEWGKKYIVAIKVYTHEEANKKVKAESIKQWHKIGSEWYKEKIK